VEETEIGTREVGPQPPDFSSASQQYAQSRPRYPPELFGHLASLVHRHRLAWDCATGSGQAAVSLVGHFEQVVATDLSAEQLRHATPHPRIEYRVAPAERCGLDDASSDLITVASAVHWFDLPAFFTEVRRVLRPGGVLAVWSYHVGHVEPPFDRVFGRLYHDLLSPYFASGARWVDERYETLTLPGEPLPSPPLRVTAEWNLEQMRAFVGTWSGTRRYLREHGKDPLDTVARELEELCGSADAVHAVRWPLYLRVSRL
jgi:SAM-dependent methyltransferase